jgi:hypothetical protein
MPWMGSLRVESATRVPASDSDRGAVAELDWFGGPVAARHGDEAATLIPAARTAQHSTAQHSTAQHNTAHKKNVLAELSMAA